jgi:hypothetical protein
MTATGPYIVTHEREAPMEPCGRVQAESRVRLDTIYREAFAALEQATNAVQRVIDRLAFAQNGAVPYHDLLPALHRLAVLPDSGDTIPLPDGSVIVVEAREIQQLAADLSWSADSVLASSDATILAAWNAEHGIRVEAEAKAADPWAHLLPSGVVARRRGRADRRVKPATHVVCVRFEAGIEAVYAWCRSEALAAAALRKAERAKFDAAWMEPVNGGGPVERGESQCS